MIQNGIPVAVGYVVEVDNMIHTPTLKDGIALETPRDLQAMVEKLAEQLLDSQKNEISILKKLTEKQESKIAS